MSSLRDYSQNYFMDETLSVSEEGSVFGRKKNEFSSFMLTVSYTK